MTRCVIFGSRSFALALLLVVASAIPASGTMDNLEPGRGDALLETLVVPGGSTTPVQTQVDFSPDVAYTLVISGTVRSYDDSSSDAPPASHDAFYCVDGCRDAPGRSGALRMKAQLNFEHSEDRAYEFKPIDEFVRGTFDQPVYRPDHRYGIRLGDPVFYRPAGRLSFVDGIPPRADRPSSGSWTIEIWGRRTESAAACSLSEPRESIPKTRDYVRWTVAAHDLKSRGEADFIGAPRAEAMPLGSKRSFYGDVTGTTCYRDGARHLELVHLPESHGEIHDGPNGYKALFFFRVAESDDKRCPKGSVGLLTLFDSRRPGMRDQAHVEIDRPCEGVDRRLRSGVTVRLPLRVKARR